jgi:hypothetical protein
MKGIKVGLMAGLITLMASTAFAKSISLKDGGTMLWIFIIVGAIIVLRQLIPAAILFFSFVRTATKRALKKEKKAKEVALPGAEPVPTGNRKSGIVDRDARLLKSSGVERRSKVRAGAGITRKGE